MPLEIERKFLVANDGWRGFVTRQIRIRDGLIASTGGNKARVRIADFRRNNRAKEPQSRGNPD
jgi:CYTH domain-containing protein